MLPWSLEILAPGDGKSATLDPSDFTWSRIHSEEHPHFALGYDALWEQFGAVHEMEERSVLAGRFLLGCGMRYEMLVAQQNGLLAAARDHTAIWTKHQVVVHLSHVLVAPLWRRSGLAGWMRAAPILLGQKVAAAHGDSQAPITLVAEMEYDEGPPGSSCAVRLAAYERAGYLKVDPLAVDYHQPDFRPPALMDQTGGAHPLPFQLIVRQVGRETEREVSGATVRHWVQALYTLYGSQFRAEDMAHRLLSLDRLPPPDARIRLLPPTA